MAGTATAPRLTAWRDVDLARVTLLADGKDGFKRSWIMLMPEGEYDHPQYGKLAFTRPKLSEFKRNFDNRVRKIDIALDRDHDGGQATGWLEELALKDGGLWGLVRWTRLGEQLLGDQIYRYFSPEFGTFTDPESGKKFENVIIGGGLTNRPFLKTMPAVKLKDKARFQRPGQYTKSDRAKIPAEDFAGPNQTFPIVTQQDVHDAARLIGHAANPAAVKARIKAIATRKGFALPASWADDGADQAKASEGAGEMTRKRSAKLDEQEQEFDEQDDADELDETEAGDEAEDEDLDEDADESEEADEGDADEDESGEGEGQTFADKKPMAKSSGKGKKPANDAEDAADGGADEDEELDDGSADDEMYDDEDAEGESAPPAKQRGEKGKAMKAGSRKMTEPQMEAEIARLREENKSLREEQFKLGVSQKLREFTRSIRDTDGADEEFALPRSFKAAYRAHMLTHGIRLNETALESLNDLVQLALKVGTVPLVSLANQIERGNVTDADDRRPRATLDETDRTAEAEKIALSEFKKTLQELEMDDRMSIYLRLEAARQRRGMPAA